MTNNPKTPVCVTFTKIRWLVNVKGSFLRLREMANPKIWGWRIVMANLHQKNISRGNLMANTLVFESEILQHFFLDGRGEGAVVFFFGVEMPIFIGDELHFSELSPSQIEFFSRLI